MLRTHGWKYQKWFQALLATNPGIWKLLCVLRIFLKIRATGAYCALGRIQIGRRQYESAAHCFMKAIHLNPRLKDPYLELIDLLASNPHIVVKGLRSPHGIPQEGFLNPTDQNQPCHDLRDNYSELCHCLAQARKFHPYDLDLYQKCCALWEGGELNLAEEHCRRGQEVKKVLAQARQMSNSGVRYLQECWVHNIGHIQGLDWYVKAGLLGWRPPQKTVLLAPADKISNPPYLDYFRPFLDEIITEPSRIHKLLPEVECWGEDMLMVRLRGKLVFINDARCGVQKQWETEERLPLLTLRPEDAARGRARLGKLGVPDGAWFVGLHVRTHGFRGKERDESARNANVDTFGLAIQSVTSRGGWVIRMGDPGMKKLKPMNRVVDYAHSDLRCDWMDVFLCASMRFMIGTQSGLSHVPHTFGVPSVITNWISLGIPPWFGKDLFIPKLFWLQKENRHLSLKEILSSGLGTVYRPSLFLRKGISLLDNRPEDINDVVVEMLERLEKNPKPLQTTDLNRQVWNIAHGHGVMYLCQLGEAFLLKYPFFLDPNGRAHGSAVGTQTDSII